MAGIAIWNMRCKVMILPSCCKSNCMFILTLRSLFVAHPRSTVAGPLMCGPVPELSVGGGGGGLKLWLISNPQAE